MSAAGKADKKIKPLTLLGLIISFNIATYLIFVLSLKIGITFYGAVSDVLVLSVLFFVLNLLPRPHVRKWLFLALTLAINTLYVIDITYFYMFKSFSSVSSVRFAHNVVGQSFGIKIPLPGVFIIILFAVLSLFAFIFKACQLAGKSDQLRVRISIFSVFLIAILGINLPAVIINNRAANAYDDYELDYIHSESYLYNKMYSSRQYVKSFGYCNFRVRDAFSKLENNPLDKEQIEDYFNGHYTVKSANTMTGALSGSNLITVLGETFDQRYTDPDFMGERLSLLAAANQTNLKAPLTPQILGHSFAAAISPNLYNIRNSAYTFDNYYVPTFFEGATINTEFMAFNSQYALTSAKNYTANFGDTYHNNDFSAYSLPAQLKQNGYSTYYIHNDSEIFYNRKTLTTNQGFDNCYFDEDLVAAGTETERIYDTRLIEFFALFEDRLINGDNFFINIDTYSMHSGSENKYLMHLPQVEQAFETAGINTKQIDKDIIIYYTKIVEFDNFLGMLLDKLAELGLSENTAVLIFPDHYNYSLTPSVMQNYLGVDPLSYEVHKNKMFLLSNRLTPGKDTTLSSTIDITPTLLNMLIGAEGDNARYKYFMGEDIFDGNERFVAFSDLTVFDGTTTLYATGDIGIDGQVYKQIDIPDFIDQMSLTNLTAFQIDIIKEFEISKAMLALDFFK